MNMKKLLLITAFSGMVASAAVADPYTVPANANIFSAGLLAPVAPAGGGAGVLPVSISIAPSTTVFQFFASGTYNYDGIHTVGPDGNSNPLDWSPMDVNPYGGLSGFHGPTSPLVGVFLTSAAPQPPAPPTLDFTGNNLHPNFLVLAPQVGQLFFIGDGLADGSGATQTFVVPTGATRLFLGIPDCYNLAGDPGYYGDNTGSLSVTVTQIPEPTAAALMGLGIALLLARRSGRERRQKAD